MAFMKSKDGNDAVIDCTCGCNDGIRIKVSPSKRDGDSYVILSYVNGNFYRDQNHGVFRVIGDKLKKIWRVIRNKDCCYSEILLSKKELEELKEYLNGIE